LTALADRIRGIVAPRGVAEPRVDPGDGIAGGRDIAAILGGAWRSGGTGQCFVVERRWDPSATYGRERIGALADRLNRAAGEAPLFTGGSPARPPFVFFDLETTGLNGGAGTLAFLVGCGWFDADGAYTTRQFLLGRHADEHTLLEAVAVELARAGALVSFNGKSFDAPLLEGRYLFHRIAWRGREMPHVDVLHPARRFWRPPVARPYQGGVGGAGIPGLRGEGCSLQALERQLVGARRKGDVPGFEIPARYFQFVRSGDAGPLEAILEHNRLDLLTLAAITARLLDMARNGPDSIGEPREALALGHVYMRAGLDERAHACFRRALDRCRSPRGAFDPLRIDVLHALALACRRARRHEEAVASWRELTEMRGCPAAIVREATEALAIHHEHRVRDLALARQFAFDSLAAASGAAPSIAHAVRHRLARIERKIGESRIGELLD
jgi:hypothetical protein